MTASLVDPWREPSFRLARRFSPLSGDGQEKGKKKASDGRHDGKNPDVFNGPLEEAKIALVEVKNRAGADEEKYFELVSVARGHPPKSNLDSSRDSKTQLPRTR